MERLQIHKCQPLMNATVNLGVAYSARVFLASLGRITMFHKVSSNIVYHARDVSVLNFIREVLGSNIGKGI
jgi:hypothetical protein